MTYRQYDYPNYEYCQMSAAASACGAFMVANILKHDPVEIMEWLKAHGHAVPYQGTTWSGPAECLTAFGGNGILIATGMDGVMSHEIFNRWAAWIQQGYKGGLLMHPCKNTYWTREGHYIAVTAYDYETDRYYVEDSGNAGRDGWHPFSDFAGDISALYTSTVRWCEGAPASEIAVDGDWGYNTTRKAQAVFGTVIDGKVSDQYAGNIGYMPGCLGSSWEFSFNCKHGSELIKAIQKTVGADPDGIMGMYTIIAMQKWLGVEPDGYMGPKTVKAFQEYLNSK